VDGLVGAVQPGKVADLIVVDGDPLTDLAMLTDPSRLWLVLRAERWQHGAAGSCHDVAEVSR